MSYRQPKMDTVKRQLYSKSYKDNKSSKKRRDAIRIKQYKAYKIKIKCKVTKVKSKNN